MTNDEKESIANAINSMRIIGTMCEKCRMPNCICRVNYAKLKAIDDNYKWIVLDKVVYRVRIDHYSDLMNTLNCKIEGCNCKYQVCVMIKNCYKPYTKPHHNFTTPKKNELKL